MNKKTLLPLAFVPLAVTNLQAQSNMQIERADKRPNIILFMVDDMGWQDTSLPFWTQKTHYNELYETPNMERLAKQGMMFTQAYANSISSPTRCSLITGTRGFFCRYPAGIKDCSCGIGACRFLAATEIRPHRHGENSPPAPSARQGRH